MATITPVDYDDEDATELKFGKGKLFSECTFP